MPKDGKDKTTIDQNNIWTLYLETIGASREVKGEVVYVQGKQERRFWVTGDLLLDPKKPKYESVQSVHSQLFRRLPNPIESTREQEINLEAMVKSNSHLTTDNGANPPTIAGHQNTAENETIKNDFA